MKEWVEIKVADIKKIQIFTNGQSICPVEIFIATSSTSFLWERIYKNLNSKNVQMKWRQTRKAKLTYRRVSTWF